MKKMLLVFGFLPLSVFAFENTSFLRNIPFDKRLKDPTHAVLTKGGRLIVADGGADKLVVFSPEGAFEAAWGGSGKKLGQLSGPQGLSLDEEGCLFVADAGNNRVQVFDADGKALWVFGEKGEALGEFKNPVAVAATNDGFVYVLDAGNNRVQLLSRNGVPFFQFGKEGTGKGEFKNPTALAVSPAGALYVLDEGNKRIQKFLSNGQFVKFLELTASSAKGKSVKAEPQSLAVDAAGGLYVVDGNTRKLLVTDGDGAFQGAYGQTGKGERDFKQMSLVATAWDGRVALLDRSRRLAHLVQLEWETPRAMLWPVPTLRLHATPLPREPLEGDAAAFFPGGRAVLKRKARSVQVFKSTDAASFVTIGPQKKGAAGIDDAVALAVHGNTLYVADDGAKKILLYTLEGVPAELPSMGSPGKKLGQLKSLQAVAVDAQGRVVVLDDGLVRGQIFSKGGAPLLAFGARGDSQGKWLQPTRVVALSQGLAVLDSKRLAVLLYDPKGNFKSEVAAGFIDPVGLVADPRGAGDAFHVLDTGAGRLKTYNGQGQLVAAFGSASDLGGGKYLTMTPAGVLCVLDGKTATRYDVTLVPRAPDAFKSVANDGVVNLSWAPDAEKWAQGYALYRSTSPTVPGQLLRYVETDVLQALDSAVTPNVTYYYSLTAYGQSSAGERWESAHTKTSATALLSRNLPSIEISTVSLRHVFSAQYKHYQDNPVGEIEIRNNAEKVFQQIRVGFVIQDHMDYPTEATVDRLGPGEATTLGLKAVFNNKILSLTEDTPVQSQITLTYYEGQEEKTLKRTHPFKIYSRNAMSWDDPRRLATFVTPKDPPLLDFARGLTRSYQKELGATPLDESFAKAAVVFEGLGVHGLSYQKDPNNPYEKAVTNAGAIDFVQYPRETLRRKSGDCDDLTNLYASALEALSIPTAFVDVPGHVLMAFQVEDDSSVLEDESFEFEGDRWVPVEVTLLGKSFTEAWRAGAKHYFEAQAQNKARVFPVAQAWALYQPATLPTETALTAPPRGNVEEKFPKSLDKLEEARLKVLAQALRENIKEGRAVEASLLQLGLLCADHDRLKESAQAFDDLLKKKPDDAAALNNRGNLYLLQKDPAKAKTLYEKALLHDATDPRLRLNMARAALALGDKKGAQAAFEKAIKLDPSLKKEIKSVQELAQ